MRTAFLLLFATALASTEAHAMELPTYACGERQILPRDLKLAVAGKCGKPTLADQRVETADDGTLVTVDEWSYNFGPYQPIVVFRFDNGRLSRIETGDYGD